MSNTMRAIAAPMTARSIRCCASAPIVAPTSSTIDSPRRVGHIAASAGRSISGSMCRQTLAIAIRAPVLPAETAQSASPFFTASIARHIEEVRRPDRSAWLGLSVILIATSQWTTVALAASRAMRGEQGRDFLLVAEKEKAHVGPAFERDRRRRDDDRRPVIAAHHVERYPNVAIHRIIDPAAAAFQRFRLKLRRDNSGFAAQGNRCAIALRSQRGASRPARLSVSRFRAPGASARAFERGER